MAIVEMDGIGRTSAPDGQRLVLAIMDAGVDILHRCGGNARCTTCRVQILDGNPGPMTDIERDKLATSMRSRRTCGSPARYAAAMTCR